MNILQNDPLDQWIRSAVPPPVPIIAPTADFLLRRRRRRRTAQRSFMAATGAMCVWLFGLYCWTPPRDSAPPSIANHPTTIPAEPDRSAEAAIPSADDAVRAAEPLRIVWTDSETGQAVAVGYLKPARLRRLPLWQLPPAVQDDIRRQWSADGQPLHSQPNPQTISI